MKMAIIRPTARVLAVLILAMLVVDHGAVQARSEHKKRKPHKFKPPVSPGGVGAACPGAQENPALSEFFYQTSCPGAPNLISKLIKAEVARDKTIPAALVRLHFHDCFVRGCDASVLINSTSSNSAEQSARANAGSLRGFEVVERVKAAVEKLCSGTVSCADILASASRDSLVAIAGSGAGFRVPLGRRDGLISSASEADANLPSPFLGSGLLQNFASKGLTTKDMVVLSGSHTIGLAHCAAILPRIYDFNGVSGATDPALDPAFADELRAQCPRGSPGILNPMDPSGSRPPNQTFDNQYFKDVLAGRGNFVSDSALISTPEGRALVMVEATSPFVPFFHDFGCAMEKMGRIGVLTGTQGTIRKVCATL